MEKFPEKAKTARISLGLSQAALAHILGVSSRSVQAYEWGEKVPRPAMMAKLARTLKVSTKYLTDDDCEDPVAEIEKDSEFIERVYRTGLGVNNIQDLLDRSKMLFADPLLSQEKKDKFFLSLMTTYITYRNVTNMNEEPNQF